MCSILLRKKECLVSGVKKAINIYNWQLYLSWQTSWLALFTVSWQEPTLKKRLLKLFCILVYNDLNLSKVEGKPGLWKNVPLMFVTPPQVFETRKKKKEKKSISLEIYSSVDLLMQQTPKPLAQVPDLMPPLFSQSFELRHVPLLPVKLWHGSFLKETIVNRDKTKNYCFFI